MWTVYVMTSGDITNPVIYDNKKKGFTIGYTGDIPTKFDDHGLRQALWMIKKVFGDRVIRFNVYPHDC